MRNDVTTHEFNEKFYNLKNWSLERRSYGYTPDFDETRPADYYYIRCLDANDDKRIGIPLTLMFELATFFDTENIDFMSDYEGDLSDLTPGAGREIWIEIRP